MAARERQSTKHTTEYNEFFRQLMFVGGLLLLGFIIFWQLKFFVGAVLGAFTLYVVFRGWNFRITEKWNWKPWVAGLALTFFCFLLLSALGYGAYKVIAAEMPDVDASQVVEKLGGLKNKVNNAIGYEVVNEDTMQKSGNIATKIVSAVFNTTYSFTANVFMMLVIVYFMFTKGRKMECYIYQYIPFKGKSLDMLRREIKNIVYSNAVGIPLIMVIQTFTSAFIYWMVDMDNYLFWGFLTALCGLVPLIGSGIVYGAISVYFAATGDIWTGVIVLVYGILIISNTDNVIRIILLRKVNNTHPLIVIFGVILGIPLFGFWGIIFGPLLLSVFFLLIRIYYFEYRLLTPLDKAERLAHTSLAGSPVPVRSMNDIAAIRAFRSLRGVRVDEKALHEMEGNEEGEGFPEDHCSCVGPQAKKKKKGYHDTPDQKIDREMKGDRGRKKK